MKAFLILTFFLICQLSRGQVPVSKEPRHHVVFENSKVRILNVLLPPRDTTQYHIHSTPSVFIGLSNTRTGSQLLHQLPDSGQFDAGHVFYEDLSPPHTRVHRVWNMDGKVFHVIDLELLGKDSGFTEQPLQAPFIRLETDTPRVRTYKITLAPNGQITIREKNRSLALVALKEEKVSAAVNKKQPVLFLAAGDFFWLDPDDRITLRNNGTLPANLALIEIR